MEEEISWFEVATLKLMPWKYLKIRNHWESPLGPNEAIHLGSRLSFGKIGMGPCASDIWEDEHPRHPRLAYYKGVHQGVFDS